MTVALLLACFVDVPTRKQVQYSPKHEWDCGDLLCQFRIEMSSEICGNLNSILGFEK